MKQFRWQLGHLWMTSSSLGDPTKQHKWFAGCFGRIPRLRTRKQPMGGLRKVQWLKITSKDVVFITKNPRVMSRWVSTSIVYSKVWRHYTVTMATSGIHLQMNRNGFRCRAGNWREKYQLNKITLSCVFQRYNAWRVVFFHIKTMHIICADIRNELVRLLWTDRPLLVLHIPLQETNTKMDQLWMRN